MKRGSGSWLAATGLGCVLLATTCAQQDPGSMTGAGGMTGAAGTTGGAGTTGTAGTSGNAGTTGSAGASGAAGAAGSAGATGAAGATGSAGATGAAGTTGAAGATGAAGNTGTAGSGGRGGATGSAGATGTGGAAGAPDINAIVPGLDGYYWEGTCSGNVTASGRNCPFYDANVTTCAPGTSWDNRGTIKTKTLSVGGTPGQVYTINFEIRGIVGTRCYTGGTIASTAVPNATGVNNTWYVGGKQYNDSIWNTYEIHVSPVPAGKPSVYFANAFGTDTVNTSWCQKEATYQVGYTASLAVVGGGTITFTIHDTNCQAQQNCGSDDTATVCNQMRTVSLSDLSPPGSFAQPPTNNVGGKSYYPQWLYFDVKSVSSP
jgi:hypothetical protein